MKLIKKLKPEYKSILENNNISYPALIDRISSCFEEQEYVTDIPYGIWMDIQFFTKVNSPFNLFTDNI
tara:strand:- start:190 stop:393 length:204 start_codon:yes stop_codon:yes gene_type:complete